MSTDEARPSGYEAISAQRLRELIGPEPLRSPLAASLAREVRSMVSDGRVPVGVRLPPERELAAALGISRVTASAAYRRLREKGWAAARQGSGTWTTSPARGVVAAWVPGAPREGLLDLSYAAPSGPPQVADAYRAALDALPRHLPGHGYAPEGLLELRERVAARYAARGLPTTVDQVLITLGATGGVTSALRALVDTGDRVLVEHPVWPNALDVLAVLRARPVPVPRALDEPGEVSASAAFVVAAHRSARQTSARAMYLTPDFANPTGASLTSGDREHLAVSMVQSGVTVIADETLVDLPLDGQDVPPPLAAFAQPGTVVSVGSLSKPVWAGLRVGWLRGEREFLAKVASAMSRDHGSASILDQLAACALLDDMAEEGGGPHGSSGLERRRCELRLRRDVLVAGLAHHLPDWRVPVAPGGLSLWCQLPPDLSCTLVVDAAEPLGLRLATGSRFGVGHAFDDRLRLPFVAAPDVLERGVELLADAVRTVRGDRHARVARPLAPARAERALLG